MDDKTVFKKHIMLIRTENKMFKAWVRRCALCPCAAQSISIAIRGVGHGKCSSYKKREKNEWTSHTYGTPLNYRPAGNIGQRDATDRLAEHHNAYYWRVVLMYRDITALR